MGHGELQHFFTEMQLIPLTAENSFFFSHLKGNEAEEIMRLVMIVIDFSEFNF